LSRIGCVAEQLLCGVHPPLYYAAHDEPPPAGARFSTLHHNCSGKHSGMLAYCRQCGLAVDAYVAFDHPLQQAIRTAVAHLTGVAEADLRRTLFEETGGMFPELVTRLDLQVFLPPIGGTTVYLFGDVEKLNNARTLLTCRVHDECNGSDVFGSDICTCRPYLIHGIEECARGAQSGGLGIIVYNRKEGRALGEVTKFLVYNARKRQTGGDAASTYFERTECVAGVQDARFQQLMPDVIHWLGRTRIDRFVSMSDMKYDALVGQGVDIVERVPLPDELIPADAHVEIAAKKAAGYYTPEPPKPESLLDSLGRTLDKY